MNTIELTRENIETIAQSLEKLEAQFRDETKGIKTTGLSLTPGFGLNTVLLNGKTTPFIHGKSLAEIVAKVKAVAIPNSEAVKLRAEAAKLLQEADAIEAAI